MITDPNDMLHESIAVVVAHAGHETTVPVGLRVAVGALAGLIAVLLCSPALLVSRRLREVTVAALGDLEGSDPAAVARSTIAAVLLGLGLALGALFEMVVVWIEQFRPVSIVIGGRVTATDLVAVGLVAGIVIWATSPSIRSRPDVFDRGDVGRVVVVSIAYGLAVLAVISVLHTSLTLPV